MAMAFLKRGLTCNVYTYTGLVYGFCREGLYEVAYWVIDKMRNDGCEPNVVTYTTAIKFLCQDGKRFPRRFAKGRPSQICEKDMDTALELFDLFERVGNGLDSVTFNTIMSAACKQGNSSMIRRIWYGMEREGIKLDVVGFTCLIQYFLTVGKFSECFRLLDSMIVAGHAPATVTYNVLLDGLCKKGLLGTERKVVELVDMAIEGCELDAIAFGILSHAISKGGTKRFPEAMKALEFLMRNNSKRGTQLWIQTG
ncbi:hypothetical protein AAC387_Pa07g1514 [Persea americana]